MCTALVLQESEGEDAEASRVVMPEGGAGAAGGGGGGARQSRVRLHEIGPRLDMEVVKVEEGLCTGQVSSSSKGLGLKL